MFSLGFVYDDAEQAEATFKNEIKHFSIPASQPHGRCGAAPALIEGAEVAAPPRPAWPPRARPC